MRRMNFKTTEVIEVRETGILTQELDRAVFTIEDQDFGLIDFGECRLFREWSDKYPYVCSFCSFLRTEEGYPQAEYVREYLAQTKHHPDTLIESAADFVTLDGVYVKGREENDPFNVPIPF